MPVNSFLCHRLLLCTLVLACFMLPSVAQEPDGDDPGSASITDISTYDAFSVAGTAPGVPQGSIFAGFENNEQVQMYNGDLLVSHPSSLSFPVDGGGSFSLTRVYNSIRVIDNQLRDREDPSHVKSFLAGDGWVGYGWLMHFGRVFRRAKENSNSCLELSHQFCDRDFVFEDGVGTQTVFGTKSSVDDQDHSTRRGRPVLRILFFKAPGGDCEKAMQQPTWCDQRPTAAECTAYGNHCDPSSDGAAHYEVTQEDGTVLRLERLVDDDLGYRDYIKNHHRNGWYVTEIRLVNGATVLVKYHYTECRKTQGETACSAKYPFREAIASVTSSQFPTQTISTTVWASEDAGLVTGTVGMLKTVTATGPSAQVATYQFFYELKDESDSNGVRQVPVLKSVTLPSTGGSASTIAYSYRNGLSPSNFDYPGTGPLLESITYPNGGVSRYGYGSWVCGARKLTPPPNDPPCWNAGQRRCMGVVRRTLLPSGTAGSDQPQADWTWTRRVSARQCCDEEQSVDGTNELSLRGPDGRIQIATTMGSACAPAGAGLIATETTFEGRTTATPLRRDSHSYELKQVKRTDTDYLDDTGQCGDGGHSGTPARMTVDRRRMTNWADWDLTWIKGHYLRGAEDDGDGSGRVVYLEHDDPTTMPSARLAKHVVGRYDTVWVEEDGERREVTYAFDTGAPGAGDTGTLRRITVKDEKLAATASLSETSETADWTNDGSDNDDLQSELQYYAYGNLQQVAFRGGDLSPDGTRAEYTVAYAAWDKAMPTSVAMQGASYNKRKIESDQGAIRYTWDANDTRTAYSYDGLGRLTEITPETGEWATRIGYPSLAETRVIQSAGSETTWTPSDPGQLYTEERYDGLGRVVERRRAVPGGGRSLQIVRYDGLGREVFVSEWMNESEYPSLATGGEWRDDVPADTDFDGSATVDRNWSYRITGIPMRNGRPLGRTTFYGTPSTAVPDNPLLASPDGLGRVREVHQADGSVSTTEYCGLRETTRVFGVDANGDGTAGSGETVTTIHYKDGLGRLVMVDTDAEAPDGTGDGADAVYEYDSRGLVTKVTLLSQLPADPFQAWREGTISGGQERTFQFDAAGRLRQAVNPESGTQVFDRYDVWGNLLAWRDAQASRRGYFFQSTYDSSGRPTKLERRLGTPDVPSNTDWSAITGASRDFDASLGSWEKGKVNPTTQAFSTTATVWGHGTYGCVPHPPSGSGSGALVLGSGCSYQAASASEWEVVRLFTTGWVHRDSVLTFWYWRNVRESTDGTRDAFEVWADLGGNDVSDRRVLFRLDEGDVSYSAMLKSPPIRLGDFFSPDDWPDPDGTQPTKMLYIYFAFRKGDAAQTGLGSGIVVDNVTLTRPVRETLSQIDYDQDLCSSTTIPAGTACEEGQVSDNKELDRITRVRSYEDGHVVVDKRLAYKGLNGRLSGVRQLMDWKGLTTEGADAHWASTVWRLAYWGDGTTVHVTAPFANSAEGPLYTYFYDRGLVTRIKSGDTMLLGTAPDAPGVIFDASGSPKSVSFANGAGHSISRDDLSRPTAQTVWGPDAPSKYWTSGAYRYDGAGNILEIGNQSFGYDGALRLVRSRVLPQAQSPSTTTDFDVVTNAYDIYGNMTSQTRTECSTPTAPSIDFTLNFGGTGASNRNQVIGSMFSYDANGNAMRYTNRVGGQDAGVGSLWDSQNRMTAFVQGELWSRDSAPGEWYGYDADGFRWKRLSRERDGRLLLTIRDAEGRALAEFGADPTGSLRLERDFVYGLGQLLVERRVTNAPPVLGLAVPLYSAGAYHFTVSTDAPAASYEADISTVSGFRSTVSGLVADANHQIHIPESALAPTATNFVRVRVEGDNGTGYSAPVSVVFDPTVTSSSPNQIRSLGVYRNGNDIVLRWALLTANGKKTNVYFRRVDNGTSYLLTPMALTSGIRAYTLNAQALSAPCVDFYLKQVLEYETDSTPDLRNPSSVSGGQGAGGDGCNDPPPAPPSPIPSFENAYHHRDHLGTLRNITNDAGHLVSAFDLYPFGLRMPTGSDGLYASRRVFTGHERDVPTGLDYMLARYETTSTGAFNGTDPRSESVIGRHSGTWNRYAYVRGRPLVLVDPQGGIPRAPGSGGGRNNTIQIPVVNITFIGCGQMTQSWTQRFLDTHPVAQQTVSKYVGAGVELRLTTEELKNKDGRFDALTTAVTDWDQLPDEAKNEYMQTFDKNSELAVQRLAYYQQRMYAGVITIAERLIGSDSERRRAAFGATLGHELGHANHAIDNLPEYLRWVNEHMGLEHDYVDAYLALLGLD